MAPDLQLIQCASDSTSLNLIGWYFDMRQNPVTDLNIALRAAGAEPTAAPTGTPRSGPVASASWSAQCRASTADSAPDGDHSDSARLCEAVVDVVPRLGHQHAPMFAAGHRLVDDAALGCETDLIQCRSELIVEERAGSRAILSPPARKPFGLPQGARSYLKLHRMARSLAQSSSSLTT
jgi:hypothetical protein